MFVRSISQQSYLFLHLNIDLKLKSPFLFPLKSLIYSVSANMAAIIYCNSYSPLAASKWINPTTLPTKASTFLTTPKYNSQTMFSVSFRMGRLGLWWYLLIISEKLQSFLFTHKLGFFFLAEREAIFPEGMCNLNCFGSWVNNWNPIFTWCICS